MFYPRLRSVIDDMYEEGDVVIGSSALNLLKVIDGHGYPIDIEKINEVPGISTATTRTHMFRGYSETDLVDKIRVSSLFRATVEAKLFGNLEDSYQAVEYLSYNNKLGSFVEYLKSKGYYKLFEKDIEEIRGENIV